VDVRAATPDDAPYVRATLEDGFGSTLVAGHGELMDATAQTALVAWHDGERVGLLTYRAAPDETAREVVTINTTTSGIGAGAALLAAVREHARAAGVRRSWLVTTSDNTHAP
jgi:N-acetylglutamate synthase-like GNAT family acetyltransferase